MEGVLVSHKVGLLAKDKGFDLRCRNWIGEEGKTFNLNAWTYNTNKGNRSDFVCTLPDQSILANWLRDVHNLHIVIHVHKTGWTFNIHSIKNNREDKFLYSSILESIAGGLYVDTYREIMELALEKALSY